MRKKMYKMERVGFSNDNGFLGTPWCAAVDEGWSDPFWGGLVSAPDDLAYASFSNAGC